MACISEPKAHDQSLPQSLTYFAIAVLLITLVGSLAELFNHHLLHLGYPYDSPFVAPISLCDDLLDWVPRFRFMHSARILQMQPQLAYPAPGYVIYWLLYLTGYARTAFAVITTAIAGAALLGFYRTLRSACVESNSALTLSSVLVATSYPLAFVVYTANIEIVVWACTLLGIWSYCKKRNASAAIFFAFATALKFYAMIYFLLYLRRKGWPWIVLGAAVAVLTNLTSLWLVDPNMHESSALINHATKSFIGLIALHYGQGITGADHSFWAMVKFVGQIWRDSYSKISLLSFMLLEALLVSAMWFLRVRKNKLWQRVLFLTVVMVAMPPVSNDYTLVHLYAPLAILAYFIAQRGAGVAEGVALAGLAVILTPQGFVIAGAHASELKSIWLALVLVSCVLRGEQESVMLPDTVEKTRAQLSGT